MVSDRERCFAAGMNDFIAKPIEIERLYATLERYLPPTAEPEFSSAALDQLSGYQSGGRPLFEVLVEDFLRTSALTMADLEKAVEAKDFKQVSFHAHALRSDSRILGLTRLGDLCECLESDPEGGAHGLAELRECFARSRDWLLNQVPAAPPGTGCPNPRAGRDSSPSLS